MLLNEIVKGVLLEGRASAFLKFYNEIERGYDPNNFIIFDCLMTLKEYYESYMKWYNKYPEKKATDIELIPHFQKRLREIKVALQSDDVKKKIIAIDNGINQWHIDMPIIRHLQMGCRDGGEDIGPEEREWMDVEDLLSKLGKLTPEKLGPYKRIYESSGWGGMIQVQNYWVDRDGNGRKVGTHGGYAVLLSKHEVNSDDAYKWMFNKGWARVSIESHSIFVNTSLEDGGRVDLSKGQREWLKKMRDDVYPGLHLHIVNIYGKPIEI